MALCACLTVGGADGGEINTRAEVELLFNGAEMLMWVLAPSPGSKNTIPHRSAMAASPLSQK